MGVGGIGIWQLLIILLIVVMLFGTKKLRNIGGDLGGALKGFKNAMKDDNRRKRKKSLLMNLLANLPLNQKKLLKLLKAKRKLNKRTLSIHRLLAIQLKFMLCYLA